MYWFKKTTHLINDRIFDQTWSLFWQNSMGGQYVDFIGSPLLENSSRVHKGLNIVNDIIYHDCNTSTHVTFRWENSSDKEHFDKEQIGVKELFTDYQPFYTINQLFDKELLPIFKKPKLGVSEHEIVKISKKGGL